MIWWYWVLMLLYVVWATPVCYLKSGAIFWYVLCTHSGRSCYCQALVEARKTHTYPWHERGVCVGVGRGSKSEIQIMATLSKYLGEDNSDDRDKKMQPRNMTRFYSWDLYAWKVPNIEASLELWGLLKQLEGFISDPGGRYREGIHETHPNKAICLSKIVPDYPKLQFVISTSRKIDSKDVRKQLKTSK